ncbi:DUF572-domain-containing protein [Patellaria atrata CBS 101060]|uniref:DUF572-domain-containing protein n=1 Tax=Patellaria atrata CBS 101060 TaxID=1346257 RepID=A0A9P4SC74_9PEZI|nr:DUF572-domain-containing protein [Patellaria atrata CBS 101060]
MSERKVLNKYYPPDFDPLSVPRQRRSTTNQKLQTVRLDTPFPMFNSRKEITDQKYLTIPIYRFYIRYTRCSSSITFKTDPKNRDHECESEEETLGRLKREEGERNVIEDFEVKTQQTKTDMAITDALDEIRVQNARREKLQLEPTEALGTSKRSTPREQEEAFQDQSSKVIGGISILDGLCDISVPIPHFHRMKRKKKDYSTALGIKRK